MPLHTRAITYVCHYIHVPLHTCAITYTCHYIHVPLHTRAIKYMCHYIHVPLNTCAITYMWHYISSYGKAPSTLKLSVVKAEVHKLSPKSSSHLEILGARRVTRRVDGWPKILAAKKENFVGTKICSPGFVQPWLRYHVRNSVKVRHKLHSKFTVGRLDSDVFNRAN